MASRQQVAYNLQRPPTVHQIYSHVRLHKIVTQCARYVFVSRRYFTCHITSDRSQARPALGPLSPAAAAAVMDDIYYGDRSSSVTDDWSQPNDDIQTDSIYYNSSTSWSPPTGSEDAEAAFEAIVRIVVPIIFGFIAILGFVGNLSVIVVVASNLQMRSTTNTLIISLAIADLLFIVTCVPFTAVAYAIPVWPFGSIWCKVGPKNQILSKPQFCLIAPDVR